MFAWASCMLLSKQICVCEKVAWFSDRPPIRVHRRVLHHLIDPDFQTVLASSILLQLCNCHLGGKVWLVDHVTFTIGQFDVHGALFNLVSAAFNKYLRDSNPVLGRRVSWQTCKLGSEQRKVYSELSGPQYQKYISTYLPILVKIEPSVTSKKQFYNYR